MAEFRIQVIVDPSRASRGIRQTERELGRLGQTANRTRDLLQRAFAFAGLSLGIQQVVDLADTFTNLQNRLRTVTSGTAELAEVTDQLFQIANRTRSSFEGTAELYARVGLAARDLGVGQQQLLQFTESLNQAIVLSGASAQEAQAGLIQLSQGLASGALRGDELRSVLEQLPVVADVIAESLGVTRGELRELGSEGAITADIVLRAFAEAREELDDRFSQTVSTVGQAFTILRNNILEFIGSLDQGTGLSAMLAEGIIVLANNLDIVARVAAAAGIALGVQFAINGVGAATNAVRLLTLALIANPFGAFAVAATAVISVLIAFSDQIRISGDSLATLQDLGLATFEALRNGVAGIGDFFAQNFGFIADVARSVFGDVELSIESVVRFAAQAVDNLVGFFVGGVNAIIAAFNAIPPALTAIFARTFNAISQSFGSFINSIIAGINQLPGVDVGAFTPPEIEVQEAGASVGQAFSTAFNEGLDAGIGAEDALDGILARAEELATLREFRPSIDVTQPDPITTGGIVEESRQLVEALGAENEALDENSGRRAGRRAGLGRETELTGELTAAQEQANAVREAEARILEELRGPQQEYETNLQALNNLLDQGAISAQEYADQLRGIQLASLETARDLESGLQRGLLRIGEQFGDVASLAEDTLVNAFQSAEDAFVEFVTTGELDFQGLIDSILADITRLAVRSAITGPLANLLGGGGGGGGGLFGGGGGGGGGLFGGGGGGGLFGGLFGGGGGGGGGLFGGLGNIFSGLFGFNEGGSFEIGGAAGIDRNVLSVNNRPVARVSRGEAVNVTPAGQSGGRPVQVNYNISTPDANSFQRSQDQILARTQVGLSRAQRRNN